MMKPLLRIESVAVAGVATWLALAGARAQVPALTVGNTEPARDVIGRILPGTPDNSNISCRVEIRMAGGGIRPPDPTTGEGDDVLNPLVRVSYIGYNAAPGSGLFSEIFNDRLTNGVWFFVRIYDAPTPAGALYYANSETSFRAPPPPPEGYNDVTVTFQRMQLISGEEDVDSDEDGIPDALENGPLGTLPNSRDSDGDGWDDYYEVMHGTPLNANESNPIDLLLEAATVSWWTIPGLVYRLGYYKQAEDPAGYDEVWSGTATETNLAVDVEDVAVDPRGFFRAWAVTASP